MINKVSFTGKDAIVTKATTKAKNAVCDYVGEGKIFSDEARLMAEARQKGSTHPYFAPDSAIIRTESKPVVKKAEDVDVDFFAESAPHRFTAIG